MINQEPNQLTPVNHQTTAGNPNTEQFNGTGSTKRKLQFQSSPISKKPNLSPSPSSSSGQFLDGFKKIQLPPTILRCTISEPIDSIRNQSPESLSNLSLQRTLSYPITTLMFTQSPENCKKIVSSTSGRETTPELNKMKNSLRVMSQWFSQAFEMEDNQEQEVEEEEEGFANKTENPKSKYLKLEVLK